MLLNDFSELYQNLSLILKKAATKLGFRDNYCNVFVFRKNVAKTATNLEVELKKLTEKGRLIVSIALTFA